MTDELADKYDVHLDTWNSEVLSKRINEQLDLFAQLVLHPSDMDQAAISQLISEGFCCDPLRPESRVEVYRGGALSVHRATKVSNRQSSVAFHGANGMLSALRGLTAALGNGSETYAQLKLFQIEASSEELTTRVIYEASRFGNDGGRQQTATWFCRWDQPSDGHNALPKLLGIVVEHFEEIEYSGVPNRLFVDCTQSILGHNESYQAQILPGIHHWFSRIGREFMGQFGHHGIAVGDVNGDGLDDLYVCDAGGLPNRLYIQQADGTAVDVTQESGIDVMDNSVAGLLVDLDNDSDQDIVIVTESSLHFAENDGTGKFSLRSSHDGDAGYFSLSSADYDNDGDLDLYVCGYYPTTQGPLNRGLPFPLPYHDANNGGRNLLLRNDGDFEFTDATQAAGMHVNNSRFSFSAAWEDYDGDGNVDIYVANDFGRNCLYQNKGGHFVDVAASAGVEDHASGMSVSWGDYNRDGWIDLYVSNMFSAAGNRVTYQRRFAEGVTARTVASLRRMARGNTLFVNQGDGTFRDESVAAAVTMGRWAWSSRFADLNNDGWQDLLVANGYITNGLSADL